MLQVVKQFLGEGVQLGRASTVSETDMQSLVETESGAERVIHSGLSNTEFMLAIYEIVGKIWTEHNTRPIKWHLKSIKNNS